MLSESSVKFWPPRGWLVMAIMSLGTLQASSAQALSLTPLRIETSRGATTNCKFERPFDTGTASGI